MGRYVNLGTVPTHSFCNAYNAHIISVKTRPERRWFNRYDFKVGTIYALHKPCVRAEAMIKSRAYLVRYSFCHWFMR